MKVATKIHVPGQSDVEKIKMRELGTHASHFCKKKWGNGRCMSVHMAERLASYAASGIDDQALPSELVIVLFQQDEGSRTAQQLQVSQLAKEDLSLYALEEVPKQPKDYYSNVLPARKIIENPDICHDKGAKSIVKIAENLPIGDYRMTKWTEITGTDRITGGRTAEETPDEPLQATNVGWYTELMDLTVAGAYQPLDSDNLDDSSYGLKAKAARDVWFTLSKVVINILRHWGAHIPEKGVRVITDAMSTLEDGLSLTSYLSGLMERRSSVPQTKCRRRSTETDWPGTAMRPTTRALCRRKADVTGTSPSKISSGW